MKLYTKEELQDLTAAMREGTFPQDISLPTGCSYDWQLQGTAKVGTLVLISKGRWSRIGSIGQITRLMTRKFDVLTQTGSESYNRRNWVLWGGGEWIQSRCRVLTKGSLEVAAADLAKRKAQDHKRDISEAILNLPAGDPKAQQILKRLAETLATAEKEVS